MGYVDSLLGKSETRVLTTRQHWITVVDAILVNGIAVAALLAIGGWFAAGHVVGQRPLWQTLGLAASLSLIPLARLVADVLHWWNDVCIVTNRRIIQASGIVNKHTIDSSLEKINDVVLSQSLLGRILGYGDLDILTASEFGVNKLNRIAWPIRFKTEMLNQKEDLRDLDSFGSGQARGTEAADGGEHVAERIAELDDLRRKGLISQTDFEHKKAELLSKL